MHAFRRSGFFAASHPPSLLLLLWLMLGLAGRARAQSGPIAVTPLNPLTPSPPLVPDADDDGLVSLHGLPATQSPVVRDGLDLTQNFLAVPPGTGSNPAPDPEGDSDSAEVLTGPAFGLGRGRHAGAAGSFTAAAVRELRQGQAYDARQAHLSAGPEVLSRAGEPRFHAGISSSLRSSALDAANPLAVATSYANGASTSRNVKPHDLRQGFGATLGGPLLRGRGPVARRPLFFYAFESRLRNFPAVSSPSNPDFYRLTLSQRDLLLNRGLSNAQIEAGLNYVSSLTGETPRTSSQTVHFGRIDWSPRARIGLSLQYNRVRWSAPAGLIDAPVVARGRASLGTASGAIDQVLLRQTSAWKPKLNNELTFEFARDLQFESAQSPLAQEAAGAVAGTSPEVVVGPNGLLFGTPASLAQGAYPDERQLRVGETLTYAPAHHALAVGGTAAFVQDETATLANAAGTFYYDSTRTTASAGGLVDFLTDFTFNARTLPNGACPAITAATHLFCFNSYAQAFGRQAISFQTQVYAAFADETWNPRRGLTIHAGLRYDYTLLPLPQFPNAALDALFASRGASSVFPEDRNNFGPRAALAWAPLGAGRGTVRLGYGLFYGRLPGATIRAALADTAQAAATTRIRILPSTLVNCPAGQSPNAGQPFGYPCTFAAQPAGAVAQTTSTVVFARNFRLPAIQQGSLSLERSFARGTTLSIGYVLNLDRQLPASTDLNIAPSTRTAIYTLQGGTGAPGVRNGETFRLPLYTARITPSFGPVTAITSSANGNYNALELKAETHPLPTVFLRGAYTWSKTIDFAPDASATPRTDAQLDPYRNGYDKGLSSLNYPWALNAAAVWAPRPSHTFHRLLDGYDLAGSLGARAGRPYSLDLFGGTRLPGGHQSLNGSGGALYLPTVGRNTLRLPSRAHVNLSLSRTLALPRGLRLHAQAEAFNLLNSQQVESVTQRAFLVGTAVGGVTPLVFQDAATIATEGLSTQAFGTPTGTGSAASRERQLQFVVRLEF